MIKVYSHMTKCLSWNRCHNTIAECFKKLEDYCGKSETFICTTTWSHHQLSSRIMYTSIFLYVPEKKTDQGDLEQMCQNNSRYCLVQFVKQFVILNHCNRLYFYLHIPFQMHFIRQSHAVHAIFQNVKRDASEPFKKQFHSEYKTHNKNCPSLYK